MDGFGEMLYVTAGCRYVGNFKNNKKNGQGMGYGLFVLCIMVHRLWLQDGCDLLNAMALLVVDTGTFYYADGNIYDGDFKDDIKHGHGKLIINPGQSTHSGFYGL